MPNRRDMTIGLGLIALGAGSRAQGSASYPDRPVRIVVPLAAGGLADIAYRFAATKLSEQLGTPVVIENLPGAGSVPAALAALRSKPDGYTLMGVVSGMATAPSLFRALPYDPLKDFVPISFLSTFDLIVLANGDGRYPTFGDFIRTAKAQPGKLNIATVNPGSIQHLSAELFRSITGIQAEIIPFRSSPDAAASLLANRVDVVFESYGATRALVDAGRLRPIASTGAKRSQILPNVPTLAELGVPNFEILGWVGLAAPVGTPREIVALLNRHINNFVTSADFSRKMVELGNEAQAGTPEELRARFEGDVTKWAAVIKRAGIAPQ